MYFFLCLSVRNNSVVSLSVVSFFIDLNLSLYFHTVCDHLHMNVQGRNCSSFSLNVYKGS